MKKVQRQVRLSIRKETLRRLDELGDAELIHVAGGGNLLKSRTCTKTTTNECVTADPYTCPCA